MTANDDLEMEVQRLAQEGGEWIYDVALPQGLSTRGGSMPHTRLRRIIQIVADTICKPLAECRILDLGCLEGQFALEFAKHGAEAVGIEIRQANLDKAEFLKKAWSCENLHFHKDNVRNLRKYGSFDAVICSGILYHLPAADAVDLIRGMHEIAKLVVIDTHIALDPEIQFDEYWGKSWVEHAAGASAEQKENQRLASADNDTSFWFTRPSLINLLARIGFSSVYECFNPAHINFGQPGAGMSDRCTFVAIRGDPVKLVTSPTVNDLAERWPEGSLAYGGAEQVGARFTNLVRRLLRPVAG